MSIINNNHYTIPSNNRELRLKRCAIIGVIIIPYQVITGNYDDFVRLREKKKIIPYQVITGNYDNGCQFTLDIFIIPYQVITGNYDL